MKWPESFPTDFEDRTLILAPTGNDASLTAGFLASAGVAPKVVATVDELVTAILAGCGAVIVAEEVFSHTAVLRLFGQLKDQPSWSDVPVILITTGGQAGADRIRRLAAYGTGGNVSILERPFRPSTLVSVVEAALRARRRQYQTRKLLAELDRARETAEQASRAKDDFLAALSHELRTPLNPVLLLTTDHANDPTLPEQLRQDFELIARNVSLEARLIDDLLDLTRITRGKLILELRSLDVHRAVREASATTRSDFAEKNIGLTIDLRATQYTVAADEVRFQQILWNVLKNAAKFTPSGGHVTMETFNDDGHIAVRITDSGVGMTGDELDRVFEAFRQGNHARPNSGHRFGGLGLGLAICRMLATAHGGTIIAESPGLGRGSSFTLSLPLATSPVAPRLASPLVPPTEPREAQPRVLLVEDHDATRLSLRRLLERRGYRVAAAASVAAARALLKSEIFDLLISDLGLPDGSGYELMALLRGTSTKGIALSGYGMESDIAQSLESGFTQHLTKPVGVSALEAALETCRPPAAP